MSTLLVALALVWPVSARAQDNPADANASTAFIAWAQGHAIPIKTVDPAAASGDLASLKAIVGDAQIVCLGQTNRDAREQFELSHRVIKFLVQHMGFTVIAVENGLASSAKLNAYLLKGEGDPAAILDGTSGWETWDTEEFLSLLKWLRAYNREPAHKQKVRLYGIDITDPYDAMVDVMAYLDRVDPDYSAFLAKNPTDVRFLRADSWLQLRGRYAKMNEITRHAVDELFNGLLARVEGKRLEYVAASSEAEYDWVLREVNSVKKANDFFSIAATASQQEVDNVRTTAMVDNVFWLLDQEAKGERLVLWAHNFHVSRDYLDISTPARPQSASVYPMGKFLSADLGDKMVSIGFSCNRGDYPDSLLPPAPSESIDGVLARVGKPLFVIDLRTAPADGPVHAWLNTRNAMRGLEGVSSLVPAQAYDAIIFIEEITPAIPTPAARARLQGLGEEEMSTHTIF